MDWRRFKSIIILVLLLIVLFLGFYLVRIRLSDGKVQSKTQANVISILNKSNIKLSEETFPKRKKTYSACYVTRALEEDKAFFEKLAGEGGSYKVEDEVFEFSRIADEKTELSYDGVINICRTFMKDCGIYEDIYKEEKVEINEGSVKASFILTYDECNFFDSYIDFVVTEKGISRITGKNIIKAEENLSSYEDELLPVESIIISLPNDKKTEKEVTVENISFGYYLGKSAGVYKSVLALPVWKVEFDDNAPIYYDARNGRVINM